MTTLLLYENFIKKKECDAFIKKAKKNVGKGYWVPWEKRRVDVSKDPIIEKVQKFYNQFNLDFILEQAELCTWNEGSESELHIHNERGREDTLFNSILYLNDDFKGGEFMTKNLTFKPAPGTLILFNGRETYHGVKPIIKKERYSIIFWWAAI